MYGPVWTEAVSRQEALARAQENARAVANARNPGHGGACVLLLAAIFALNYAGQALTAYVFLPVPGRLVAPTEQMPIAHLARTLLHETQWTTAGATVKLHIDQQLNAVYDFGDGTDAHGFVALTPSICAVMVTTTNERYREMLVQHAQPLVGVFDRGDEASLDYDTLVWSSGMLKWKRV
jgi:hypothetical protein